MATTFQTLFQTEAWPQILALHGEALTYTDSAASETDVTGVFSAQIDRRIFKNYREDVKAEGTVKISAADLATVDMKGKITRDDASVWQIVEQPVRMGAIHHMLVRRYDSKRGGIRIGMFNG